MYYIHRRASAESAGEGSHKDPQATRDSSDYQFRKHAYALEVGSQYSTAERIMEVDPLVRHPLARGCAPKDFQGGISAYIVGL